jgi:hypothetical protein
METFGRDAGCTLLLSVLTFREPEVRALGRTESGRDGGLSAAGTATYPDGDRVDLRRAVSAVGAGNAMETAG